MESSSEDDVHIVSENLIGFRSSVEPVPLSNPIQLSPSPTTPDGATYPSGRLWSVRSGQFSDSDEEPSSDEVPHSTESELGGPSLDEIPSIRDSLIQRRATFMQRFNRPSIRQPVPLRPNQRFKPSNLPIKAQQVPELKQLCETLAKLSQQLHVLSQRRIAERAAANASSDAPAPETCPICFDAFHCPGTCTTRCGHVFHRKCLDACLRNNNACPVCRANIHRAELVDLMSGFGEKLDTENPDNAVVDLINEPVEERGAMDESILLAIQSVREQIDKSQGVDKLAVQVAKEKQELMEKIESREKLLETRKAEFEKQMEAEKGALNRRRGRIQRGEEMISRKEGELNTALCDVRRKESALQVQQGEVEAEAAENEKVKYELEKEKSSLREKERRMKALQEAQKHRKAKEREDSGRARIMALEQLLRSNRIAVPRETEREPNVEREPGRDAFKVDLNDDVTVVESPVKRRKIVAPTDSMLGSVFGGELKKPSLYSRPAAPRRKGVGVRSFAPEKRAVQRPAGVAQRGLNCVSRR